MNIPSQTLRTDQFVASLRPAYLALWRQERDRWIQFAQILELELMVANKRIEELEQQKPKP